MVDLILEALAALGAAAVVDLEEDPPLGDEILHQRRIPRALHRLRSRAAVMLHEHGIFLPSHQLGRDHHVMKRAAVGGLHRPELGRLMRGDVGIIGVPRRQPVLVEPGDALARGIRQIGLRGLLGVGAGEQHARRRLVHRNAAVAADAVGPARIGQALGRAHRLIVEGVDLRFERRILVAGEPDAVARLIEAEHLVDHPGATRQLGPLPPGEAVEVAVAVALGPPDQAAVLQDPQIVRQVEPAVGCRRLGEDHGRAAGRGIDLQHVEPGLLAVLALHVERRSVRRPIDACEVDVGVRPHVHLHPRRAVGVHQPQLDRGVGRARGRVALLVDSRALGADRGARDHLHLALVGALHGDAAVVGRPPMAGVAVHLLLRDELCGAPRERAAAISRKRALLAGRQIDHEQVLVAHERGVAPRLRYLGVDLGRLALGQAADVAVERRDVEVAVERHEDRLAVGRPIIGGDAAGAADAQPLASHLLRLRHLRAGADLGRIDQHAALGGGGVDRPQIEAIAIGVARQQQRDEAAVGGQLGRARLRARQRRALEHPLQRQLLRRRRGGGGCRGHGEGGGGEA